MRFPLLHREYRALLEDGIIPFWMKNGLDEEYGGVFSCMREDGTLLSTEKYTWSQARFAWTLSALYNRFEPRPEFLIHARKTIDFLLTHCRDSQGWFVFRTSREGVALEGATSIYADFFVVYALVEYCRAVPDQALLQTARQIFDRIYRRVDEPEFSETAPYSLPPGRRIHAVPMMLILTANELAEVTGGQKYERIAAESASLVLNRFTRPPKGLIAEYLTRDYAGLPSPEGSFVNPGHAIECMWFVLHWARRTGNRGAISQATQLIRVHLEAGWDTEFGGLYLGIDAHGGEPFLPNSDKKLWWPHTEALYALLLSYKLTAEPWCLEWFERVQEWSFAHFSMPNGGEWRQRLDRKGNPIEDTVALPVKDPFHLPRAVILIHQLLESGSSTQSPAAPLPGWGSAPSGD